MLLLIIITISVSIALITMAVVAAVVWMAGAAEFSSSLVTSSVLRRLRVQPMSSKVSYGSARDETVDMARLLRSETSSYMGLRVPPKLSMGKDVSSDIFRQVLR